MNGATPPSPYTSLIVHYQYDVLAAFLEFRGKIGVQVSGRCQDLISAKKAALALVHLGDHVRAHLDSALSRSALEKLCEEFGTLSDVANALKHNTATYSTPHGPSRVRDAKDIGERLTIVRYSDEIGDYSFAEKQVIATLTDGTEVDLLGLMTAVMNFWETLLASRGVISEVHNFTYDDSIPARTRAQCRA